MKAELQILEGERLAFGNGELAIKDKARRRNLTQHGDHFGKIPRQWFSRFGAEIDIFAGAEGKAAKPVPFGLELPPFLLRQRVDEPRFHRREIEADRQARQARRFSLCARHVSPRLSNANEATCAPSARADGVT